MARIGFLHTAPVHVATFDALVAELEPSHSAVAVVDEAVLSSARRDGPGDAGVTARIVAALDHLIADGADVIVCTCSTIGAAAERIGRGCAVPVLRVDRPMIERAVDHGPRIAVIAALASTTAPTTELIEEIATERGVAIEVTVHLSTEAWARFEAGDTQGYLEAVRCTCAAAVEAGADVLVLAQASMAGAATTATRNPGIPVLASPALAVGAAAALIRTDGRCAVCGFAAPEWDVQDARRTLAHADDLLAGWSGGGSSPDDRSHDDRSQSAAGEGESSVAALARTTRSALDRDRDRDSDGDEIARAHRLWHGLVEIAELRRTAGARPTTQTGVVVQLNRSDGGVPKLPTDAAIVDHRGVVDDVQATRVHHGRPWQALCLWSDEVIRSLAAEGHPISAGAAGENVTIAGIDWPTLRAGTIVDLGTVRCQLSAPAAPCRKIRRWFTDGVVARIDHAQHPGWSRWYATVLEPGEIRPGDPVTVEPPSNWRTRQHHDAS